MDSKIKCVLDYRSESKLVREITDSFLYFLMHPPGQIGMPGNYVIDLSVRLNKLVNMVFGKRMDRFCCKLAQVVHMARA